MWNGPIGEDLGAYINVFLRYASAVGPCERNTANDTRIVFNSPLAMLGCGRGCLVKLPPVGKVGELAVSRCLAEVIHVTARSML